MQTPRSRTGRWLLFVVLAAPSLALAGLTVIYDSGNTRPLAPYMEVFDGNAHAAPPPPPARAPALGAADLEQLLPIRSPGLTPGLVPRRNMQRPFARPLFLVGSDPLSRKWLATHRDRLAEMSAVGMLVEARTVEDLRAIAALAGGLPILPASGADVAKALGLAHYPVLITRDHWEQ